MALLRTAGSGVSWNAKLTSTQRSRDIEPYVLMPLFGNSFVWKSVVMLSPSEAKANTEVLLHMEEASAG